MKQMYKYLLINNKYLSFKVINNLESFLLVNFYTFDVMELKIIKNEKEYEQYLKWVDVQFDNKIKSNTPEGEKLQVALLLIKQYEDTKYPIPLPDPIDAIKVKMDELGLKNKDLVGKVGSKGYVSSLLNKKKPLTLELAKLFHQELNIPAEVLLS